MAIEKGLYAAPQGIEDDETAGLEIEIVDPKMVTLDAVSYTHLTLPTTD